MRSAVRISIATFLMFTFPVGILVHVLMGQTTSESILSAAHVIRDVWRDEW